MSRLDDLGQAPASALVPVHIYAEFLPNIRSVTVSVTLPSQLPPPSLPCLSETTGTAVSIADDATTLNIRCNGASYGLRLPVPVDPASLLPSPIAYAVAHDISIRLRPNAIAVQGLLDTCEVNHDPWSASALEDCYSIGCAECAFTIVEQDTIRLWKDLPSANWAEMMDFWHCHKPLDHKDSTKAAGLEGKGYSASSTFSAGPRICFVNTTSLLLCPEDCRAEKNTHEQSNSLSQLQCVQCASVLGMVDQVSQSWKLYKSSLSVKSASTSESTAFTPEQWISAELLVIMESMSARKILVTEDSKQQPLLLLWLFTPDLWFSALTDQDDDPEVRGRAMKIMWKAVEPKTRNALGSQAGVEELELPNSAYVKLCQALSRNRTMLPQSSQHFQDWQVSLLRRFDVSPA